MLVTGLIMKRMKHVGRELYNIMNHRQIKQLAEYRIFLLNEIDELKGRVKPHDCGHIKTAINVLEKRVKEINRRRDGYFDWKDDMLLGIF